MSCSPHATGGVVPDGTQIGAYSVRFVGGREIDIPIIYGQDLREWHARSHPQTNLSNGQIAWRFSSCHPTRLFHSVCKGLFRLDRWLCEIISSESIQKLATGNRTFSSGSQVRRSAR